MERRTVTVAALGTLLALISYTAPLVGLREIAAELGAGPSGQAWILSSMSLGLTATLLTCGALGDDYGRRRVFVVGAVVLGLTSLGGAAAPDEVLFVAGRVLQGVGAAAVIACSLGLISHAVPAGPRRARASGTWGAALAAGIAIGPLIGAVVSWRALYAGIAVASVVLAVAARSLLQESTSGVPRAVDLPGMITLAAGLACLLAGLTEVRQPGAGAMSAALFAAGVVLLAAFVAVQLRSRAPMTAPRLFREPALVSATVAALVVGLGIIALASYLPAVLQRGLGLSPGSAAVLVLAWPAVSIVTALATRRISERIGGAARLAGGLVVVAAGELAFVGLEPTSSWLLPLVALVVAGLGTGVVNATLGREAVASVPPEQAATGSGINNTSRYLGAAIGVTLVTVLCSPTGQEDAGRLLAGWDTAAIVGTALTLLGAAVVLACGRRRVPAQVSGPSASTAS